MALNKLIADGRIHPTRIEEMVAETQTEMEQHIQKFGEEAAQEADVPGLHPKIIHLLGRLRFRTSYSQNVLRHSIEVAFLTGMLAEEMGLDGALARRCGLLHDIGKAADHEAEGGPSQDRRRTAQALRRRARSRPRRPRPSRRHPHRPSLHGAGRRGRRVQRLAPGARRETLERYIKRMEELESIATSFEGVDQAFAIQAGRELRVIANAKRHTDASAAKICHDIARAFEQQLTYPGEIKVTVLRETRVTEMAR